MTIHEFLIDRLARPALLTETREHGAALCLACAHRCLVRPGRRGICKVRYNNAGALLAPWGYVAGLAADPVEKKPFNHFLPGSRALTFGMLGCNYHCAFCQNWFTSQALRDPVAQASLTRIEEITPEQIAEIATRRDCASVVSSYNEPFITAEWARDIFMAAKARGLRTAMVSNGYGTAEALDLLAPHLDALKVDLKSMRDATYRQLGGVLANVLETISAAAARGIWVEVVTLVIPGMNDSPANSGTRRASSSVSAVTFPGMSLSIRITKWMTRRLHRPKSCARRSKSVRRPGYGMSTAATSRDGCAAARIRAAPPAIACWCAGGDL